MLHYDIAYSLLVHESPDFFDYQLSNIFKYNKNKKIYIVTHFNKFFWEKESDTLTKICKKYNVTINSETYETGWCSSQLFDAIISNINVILSNITFNYYTMIASNELFIKKGLIDYIETLDFDMIHFEYNNFKNNVQHSHRDLAAIPYDQGLQKFLQINSTKSFLGYDFGRILTYDLTKWLYNELIKHWSFPITPSMTNYSMSECVIDTVLSIKNPKVIDNLKIVQWADDTVLQKVLNNEDLEDTFLIKHVPRNIKDPFIQNFIKK